jgi:hypothetical protein
MNEWWGLSVLPYAARKEVDSSSEATARFWVRAMAVKSSPLEGVSWVERLGRRGQVPNEPHESFSCGVLFGLQFVND